MLSKAELQQFDRQGFVSSVPVMSAEEASAYRRQLERFEREQGPRSKHLLRSKSHLILTWADAIMRHPRLLDAVSDLLGPNILCWLTSFFIKDAHDGQFVSWHQDANYWGLDGVDGVVSAWVALTPSSNNNGCMRMIPGSHRERLLHRETQDGSNMLSRGQTNRGRRCDSGRYCAQSG